MKRPFAVALISLLFLFSMPAGAQTTAHHLQRTGTNSVAPRFRHVMLRSGGARAPFIAAQSCRFAQRHSVDDD